MAPDDTTTNHAQAAAATPVIPFVATMIQRQLPRARCRLVSKATIVKPEPPWRRTEPRVSKPSRPDPTPAVIAAQDSTCSKAPATQNTPHFVLPQVDGSLNRQAIASPLRKGVTASVEGSRTEKGQARMRLLLISAGTALSRAPRGACVTDRA